MLVGCKNVSPGPAVALDGPAQEGHKSSFIYEILVCINKSCIPYVLYVKE